jgi:hypothetical protein
LYYPNFQKKIQQSLCVYFNTYMFMYILIIRVIIVKICKKNIKYPEASHHEYWCEQADQLVITVLYTIPIRHAPSSGQIKKSWCGTSGNTPISGHWDHSRKANVSDRIKSRISIDFLIAAYFPLKSIYIKIVGFSSLKKKKILNFLV